VDGIGIVVGEHTEHAGKRFPRSASAACPGTVMPSAWTGKVPTSGIRDGEVARDLFGCQPGVEILGRAGVSVGRSFLIWSPAVVIDGPQEVLEFGDRRTSPYGTGTPAS
jgi:hypothetical protein